MLGLRVRPEAVPPVKTPIVSGVRPAGKFEPRPYLYNEWLRAPTGRVAPGCPDGVRPTCGADDSSAPDLAHLKQRFIWLMPRTETRRRAS
jgi:hypothetical protein